MGGSARLRFGQYLNTQNANTRKNRSPVSLVRGRKRSVYECVCVRTRFLIWSRSKRNLKKGQVGVKARLPAQDTKASDLRRPQLQVPVLFVTPWEMRGQRQ